MSIPLPSGFRFAGIASGIKASGKRDISLIVSDTPATAAGVYTQNLVVAAPVVLCRSRTPRSDVRAVIVNSGNANACTGEKGAQDALQMCSLVAEACGNDFTQEQVLVMSTGVIGRTLPMPKVQFGIQQAASALGSDESCFLNAADAILTTDAGRKISSTEIDLGGRVIRLVAMAKGAGMIGPNMATMLCCVLTDAALTSEQAHRLLQQAADMSFNNISVEGHTSTNDTMLLLANGQSGGPALSQQEEAAFLDQLTNMTIELAKQIPSDGEGATHLIEIQVTGAQSEQGARKIASTVANSNLVKTAIHGADPNWGRIVSAAGYAGVEISTAHLSLRVNGFQLFSNGEPIDFDAKAASNSIRDNRETLIELQVGAGLAKCTHWTSDLTAEYVRFNSEYTT